MFDSDSWQTSPQSRYNQAKLSIHDRSLKVAAVVESLEREMELLCLTGVEDQLQADVRPTLELLRNAGIKVRKRCLENDDILSKKSLLKLNSDLIFLRFGCWRETNWRRQRASPKAPIWSPGARTSTSSNRYALLCFDSSSRCYDTTWIIVLCGPWAGLQQRRGSSGAQRLQKETRLRSGHLWRLLRGATEQIRTPQQNRTEHNTWWHQSVQQMKPRPAAVNIRKWQNATGNK